MIIEWIKKMTYIVGAYTLLILALLKFTKSRYFKDNYLFSPTNLYISIGIFISITTLFILYSYYISSILSFEEIDEDKNIKSRHTNYPFALKT